MAKKKPPRAHRGTANSSGTAEGMMAHAMKGVGRKAKGKK